MPGRRENSYVRKDVPVPVDTPKGEYIQLGGLTVLTETREPTNLGAFDSRPASLDNGYATAILIGKHETRTVAVTEAVAAFGDEVFYDTVAKTYHNATAANRISVGHACSSVTYPTTAGDTVEIAY